MPKVSLADPLALVDERIHMAQARRAACERFSEAYWEADDELTWLRMVRDEVCRTGHVRTEIHALLLATGVGVPVMAEEDGLAEPTSGVMAAEPGRGRHGQPEDSTLVAGPARAPGTAAVIAVVAPER